MNFSQYIPFYRRNLHLALPVVFSQIGQVTVSLADNAMVGHVGTTELAAASFANSVFMIGMYFGMGITYGLTPLVGKEYGNGRLGEVIKWLKNGIFTHSFSAVFLTLIMFATYFLLPYMGQEAAVLEMSKPYYLILCASYFPFMLFFSFKQFFEGIGNTKIAMQITLISNVINIGVNYLFIFGKLGFPQLGLIGAGIGTLVSRIAMPILFAIYVGKLPRFRRFFVLAHKQVFERQRIIDLIRIGIPIAFQMIVEVISFALGAIMIGWLGEISLAAHQIALGLSSFTYMIALGISQANTIRVSHQMGQGDYKSMRMAVYASTHLVLVFMGVMGVLFVVGRYFLPLAFTADQEVIQLAGAMLIVAAIFQLFDGLQVIMLSTLRGMADVKTPMYIAVIAFLFVGIPTGYVMTFVFELGARGVWYGYLVGLGLAGVLFYHRFRRNLQQLGQA